MRDHAGKFVAEVMFCEELDHQELSKITFGAFGGDFGIRAVQADRQESAFVDDS